MGTISLVFLRQSAYGYRYAGIMTVGRFTSTPPTSLSLCKQISHVWFSRCKLLFAILGRHTLEEMDAGLDRLNPQAKSSEFPLAGRNF